MAVTGTILPKQYANKTTRHEQKKNMLSHATYVGNKQKQGEDKKISYPILCPLCHLHQIKQIKTKFTQLRIYLNVAGQVNIVKKGFYKTWTFDRSSRKYRGLMVYQTMHCSNKKVCKELRQKLVDWIMKKSNVRESPIARDTLLITDAESGVKRRVPKLLL